METAKQIARNKKKVRYAVIFGIIAAVALVLATLWIGRKATQSTEEAVHTVSRFYLQELAARRQRVVASNLNKSIKHIEDAVELMTSENLSDMAHLQSFLERVKKVYMLDRFAFVDTQGLIYTSTGTQNNIKEYGFDYVNLTAPSVSIKDLHSDHKKVIIAVPLKGIPFNGQTFICGFMEIDMEVMQEGLAIQPDSHNLTFCNLYSKDGIILMGSVMGNISEERNMLDILQNAELAKGYSLARVKEDFLKGEKGNITFTIHNIPVTMYYVPVAGTDWMLSYMIRENMVQDQIGHIATDITNRSLLLSFLTGLVLLGVFYVVVRQNQKTNKLLLAKESSEAESRGKQLELEKRLEVQKKLLEKEKQNETLKIIHDMLRSGPWSMQFDEQGNMTSVTWSDTFRKMLGYQSTEDFPDKLESWSDLLHAEDKDRVIQAFNDAIRDYSGKTIYDVEYRLLTKDQDWRWFHAIGQLSRRPDGSPQSYVGIFVDITEKKAMKKQLAEHQEALKSALAQAEESNAAKTAFLSSMSHEIRTPMNAIIGLNSIALKDPQLPERTRGYLEKIGGSAKHLLGLINDILDMSRIESGRMATRNEEFSFREMLEQINTMINGQCQAKGLSYDCHINGKVDDYYIGDNMKLKQVLINILGNSVKYTPAPGTVSFIVEPMAKFEDKATLRFIMKDTGIGMDKEFLPKIFDAFSQENENKVNSFGSTGLGMAITKNIVEMMNGKIDVESEKGVGSTFTVTITLKTTDKKDGGLSDIRPQDMHVLIIDDDPVACEHAKLVLEEVGIASESCSSGKEALELLRLAHARMQSYNLILVDLKMPEQDGVEVTRKIRELYNGESAIIILTAYSWDDVLEDAINAGVDSFMAKPLFASGVMDEFKQAILRKNLVAGEVKKADLKGKRILLAEDMMINAEIMKELLDMREMLVDHAENGKLAVDMFANSPENYYDAILMDIRMPVMTGLEATSAIRALDRPDAKSVPIIAMTANAFDEDVQRSLQSGMNAHLTKPVDPPQLYETLELLIKE